MPNYTDEELAKFREDLIAMEAGNSVYADLANDLTEARARIAELEGALDPIKRFVDARRKSDAWVGYQTPKDMWLTTLSEQEDGSTEKLTFRELETAADARRGASDEQ